MKNYLSAAILSLALLGLTACGGGKTEEKTASRQEFVTIGTGGVTGVYYPTGGAISKMINDKKEYNIKATVESTAGSVYNVNAVLKGDLDFGIVQSDRQYQAYRGLAEWQDAGPQKELRSVFSIHPESITLVASVDSGIDSVADLRGRKVNLGNTGSGQLQNTLDVFASLGMTKDDVMGEYVKAVEAPGLLQDERIDAFFYTVGHPSGAIKEATSGRIPVKIVPVSGSKVEELIKEKPYYAKSIIQVKNYPNAVNDSDVQSVGVKATFVTAAGVSDDVVYAITKEIFENFEDFKTLHPAYSALTKEDMLQGLSAPLHPGALKYYRESGLDSYLSSDIIN